MSTSFRDYAVGRSMHGQLNTLYKLLHLLRVRPIVINGSDLLVHRASKCR